MASETSGGNSVSFEVFRRSAMQGNIERGLNRWRRAGYKYALPNRGMRLVWGTGTSSRYRVLDATLRERARAC